jgi:rhodanese-related sulfurtransferase
MPRVRELTPQEAHAAWTAGELTIVDVREQVEYDTTHVPGVPLLPMSEIIERVDELPEGDLVIICRSGARSAQVADWLNAQGDWGDVANLAGGIIAWAAAGLPYEGPPPG